jgi:release factor glutamine methyltransferase
MNPHRERVVQSAMEHERCCGLPKDELSALARVRPGDGEWLRRAIKRRLLGDPLVYITNSCEMRGRSFYVDRRVYRPSANTERVLDFALEQISDGDSVMDVGTGCGWLAITIKMERPSSEVTGVDIDPGALEVACINVRKHAADVALVEADGVESQHLSEPRIIIANLPYGLPESSAQYNDVNRHMPRIALYHPAGPTAAWLELLRGLRRRRWASRVVIESGSVQRSVIAETMPPWVEWEHTSVAGCGVFQGRVHW